MDRLPYRRLLRRPSHLVALAGAMLAPALAPNARAQESSPEQSVRLAAHELHDALAAGDSAAVLELLADDVRVYESGHAETRWEYQAGHLAVDIEFAGAVERETIAEHVRTNGEGMALYLSEYRSTGTFHGEEIDSRGTETLVLERRPDGWKIVHIHWSSR